MPHGACNSYYYWLGQYWLIVLSVTAGGLLGGLLYWTSIYLAGPFSGNSEQPMKPGEPLASAFRTGASFCAANAFTGAGGAWAVLLAMIWAKRAPVDPNLLDRLALLGTSVIAGYAGNRVLPLVAERLTKELLDKAVAKTKENAESAKRSQSEAKKSLDDTKRAGKIAEINAYIARGGKGSKRISSSYMSTITSILKDDPTYKPAALALASLHWYLGDTDTSLKVLTDFAEAAEAAGGVSNKDLADVYWNIGWYHLDSYDKKADKADETELDNAATAIARSVTLMPTYKKDVTGDEAFAKLLTRANLKAALEDK